MSKYSIEFKLKVIREYLEGKTGATLLARKYNIPSSGLLRSWIRKYKAEGEAAFHKKVKQNYAYSRCFKENAVQLYLTSELTYEEVSRQLSIPTLGLLSTWVNQFRIYGEIPERQKLGRPRKIEGKSMSVYTPSLEEDRQRIKELEKQLRYATIEVEYLKGLRRLESNVQTNKKQSLFTISEKNTNSKNS